jgi:uncharacterized delta-60 repeat protein
MIQFDLFFTRGRRGSWLAACLCWLLSSAALAQVPVAPPFMVRATPTGSVGLNVGQEQLLTATAVYPAFISAGFDGPVYATAVQADGKILVGGSFSTYNNVSCQYLARLNVDGTLDASFTMGTDLDNMVYAIAVQGNGDILIGGAFTKFKGTVRGGLARLSPAGALDALFAPSSFNGGPVRAIATQPNNSVLVGGEFTSYGPTTNPALNSAYVVRLDNTGTLDSNFATNTHNAATSINVNAAVLALLPSSSGDILVGGRFSAGRRGIARLTSAGMLDTNFGPVANIPAGIEIAAIAEDGPRVWVGGSYSSSGTTTAAYLNLLDNVGQPVSSFSSGFATGTTGTSVRVNSLAVLPTGQLLVGGEFTTYATQQHGNLVALDAAGTLASNFSVGVGFDAPVRSLALAPGGNVVVGGDFTTYKDLAAKRITRLKPTGQADDIDVPVSGVATTAYTWYTVAGPVSNGNTATLLTSGAGTYWVTATITLNGVTSTSPISNTVTLTVAAPTLAPIAVHVTPPGRLSLPAAGQSQQLKAEAVYPALRVGTGFSLSPNPYKNVWSFKTQPNGKLVVGGQFTEYNGAPCKYITRLHADGSRDITFAYAGLNDVVTLVALQPNGKIVVGGNFTSYSGISGNLHKLARLNTDGSLDRSFTGGFDSSPEVIIVQPNGSMLVVGNFGNYQPSSGPLTAINIVARLLPDGALDPDFSPTGTGINTPPNTTGQSGQAMALQPDGKVLVGGEFTNYNGTPRQNIVRLNDNGKLDPSFDPTGAGLNKPVHVLALQPDGKVLVGGEFTDRLIRLNADGSRDPNFTPPSLPPPSNGAPPFVATLALQSDGKILVGGVFQGGLRRLLRDGSLDPGFFLTSPGFDGKVSTLAIQPDGQVLAGGEFSNYGGASRNGLARLNRTGSLNEFDAAVPGTATYAWSDGSTGDKLAVVASGTYSVTATFLAQTGISKDVVVGTGTLAPFTVRITPTGPLSLCANSSQTLTAQVVSTNATVPLTGNFTFQWYQVGAAGALTPVSNGNFPNNYITTYPIPGSGTTLSAGQYLVTATNITGDVAASATVSVGVAPSPSLTATTSPVTSPITGLPGDNIVLTGDNLQQVTAVEINGIPAVFAVSTSAQNAAVLNVTVPGTATNGAISLFTACNTGAAFTTASPGGFSFPRPVITTFGPVVMPNSTAVVAGTGFVMGAGATTATFTPTISGVAVTVLSRTQLIITVPPSTPSGSYTLTITTTGGSSMPVGFVVSSSAATALTTQYITSPNTLLTASSYPPNTNLIIQAPATVTISGSSTAGNIGLTVGRLEVQTGAILNITDNTVVTGPAGTTSSFLLAAGATLNVGHPNGLGGAAGTDGAIQFAELVLSPDASYGYSGSQPQVTGTNLPSQVRNLTSTNSSRLTLSQPLRVAQMLTMAGAGHFYLDTKPLTLLSSAAGTALVVNKGKGRVLGTATVQRYINPAANTGTGFRYYGSPVKGATAAMLAAPAFDYDQSRYRLTAQKDTLSPFSYGFTTSSLVPNTPLEVGHGYRASVPAATTVNFTGTLTTGDTIITLLRTGNAAYNGWNLVSNPYPAPLNWTKLVSKGSVAGLEAAIYVYESTGTNTGSYRSYVNGVSNDKLINQANDTLLIAMGQAFFVRVRQNLTSGTITFSNNYRETSYNQQASFSRTMLTRPFDVSIALERNGHGGNPLVNPTTPPQVNRTTLYIDPSGAPSINSPFNPELDADASNLFSFSQQTLSIQGGSSAADGTLAIRAIAPPTAGQRTPIPLAVTATEEGNYTMSVYVEGLSQLTPGLVPYLHDKNSSAPAFVLQDLLTTSPTAPLQYILYISAAEILSGTLFNRFEIVFQGSALATRPASAALGSAVVFPNPAQRRIHVEVPAVPGATQVQATLFNALGQPVLRQDAPLPATGTALNLAAEKLAGGVYILRLQAGSSIVTRRVLLDN